MASAILLEPSAYKPIWARHRHRPASSSSSSSPWYDAATDSPAGAMTMPAAITRSFECGFRSTSLSFFFEYMSKLVDEYQPVLSPDTPTARGSAHFLFAETERIMYFE
uniref:Uncharacterized protein n=2 Tax=Octactis speculum TaxID=3111310 RepID=A0A7S2D6F2_9STRA